MQKAKYESCVWVCIGTIELARAFVYRSCIWNSLDHVRAYFHRRLVCIVQLKSDSSCTWCMNYCGSKLSSQCTNEMHLVFFFFAYICASKNAVVVFFHSSFFSRSLPVSLRRSSSMHNLGAEYLRVCVRVAFDKFQPIEFDLNANEWHDLKKMETKKTAATTWKILWKSCRATHAFKNAFVTYR